MLQYLSQTIFNKGQITNIKSNQIKKILQVLKTRIQIRIPIFLRNIFIRVILLQLLMLLYFLCVNAENIIFRRLGFGNSNSNNNTDTLP